MPPEPSHPHPPSLLLTPLKTHISLTIISALPLDDCTLHLLFPEWQLHLLFPEWQLNSKINGVLIQVSEFVKLPVEM